MAPQRGANGCGGFDDTARGEHWRQGAPQRLALAIAILAGAATASAQGFSCTAMSVPPVIRSAGVAELVGDAVLICSGGSGGSVSVNLQVLLNVNVTTRLLNGTTSEALLLINEPAPSARAVGKNVFRGQIASPNSILWAGLSIPTPARDTTTLRIANVRVNAAQLPSTPSLPRSVVMYLTATSPTSFPINNPALTVAFSLSGFGHEVRKCDDSGATPSAAPMLPAYAGVNEELALGRSTEGNIQFNLRFREGFSNAFRNRAGESGLVLGPSDSTGQATQGTRLRAAFSGVPAGARLYVTTTALSSASSPGISATLASEGLAAPPAPAGTGYCTLARPPASAPIAAVAISKGYGTAVWEITNADPSRDETVSFGVVIAYASGGMIPGPSASVRASFSPLSSVLTASASEPAPRFRAADAESAVVAFTVVAATAPSITTESPLPQGVAGAPYSVVLSASGGAPPFGSWAVVSGRLPPGLELDPATGAIRGAPTAEGSASFVVRTVDSYGVATTKSFSMLVQSGPPVITTPSPLPVATVGMAYALPLQVSGGTAPYSWSLTGGALPAGVSLNPQTGVLAGTPVAVGTLTFTIQVTDAASRTASKLFTLTVAAALVINIAPARVPEGTVGVFFSLTLTATGGRPPYLWRHTGALPPGLLLGLSSGVISGRPLVAGEFTTLITVTDSVGAIGRRALQLLIHPPQLQAAPDRISLALGPAAKVIQQTITVVYPGEDRVSFRVQAETSSGGAWLSVAPTGGVVSTTVPVRLTVNVSPFALAPGFHVGCLVLTSTQAGVQPLRIPVVVQVREREQPQLRLSKTGMAFVTGVGVQAAARYLGILNVGQVALSWSARATTLTGGAWLTVTPEAGSSLPPGGALRVQVRASGLSAGVHYGEIVVSSREAPNSPQRVVVVNVVQAAGGPGQPAVPVWTYSGAAGERLRGSAVTSTCQASKLEPSLRIPGVGSGSLKAGRLYDLEVQVRDNCNTPVSSGTVIATFTNGDPTVDLATIQDGNWHGTWQPKNTQPSEVKITVDATSGSLSGTAALTVGGVDADPDAPPVVSRGGVLNAASYAPQSLVARGSLVAIFGSRLAPPGTSTTAVYGPSWPQVLEGTSVTLAGAQMPLYHLTESQEPGESQINAQAPFSVTASVGHQLTVYRGSTISLPEEVTVSEVLPATFATNQQGTGQGCVRIANSALLAAPSGSNASPVAAGGYIEIYCTGLGEVYPPAADGVRAPVTGALHQTVKPVRVLIDGVEVTPLFSGLAPGFVALYQVNAKVPESTKAGSAVSVQLKVEGQLQECNKVTIAVK